MSTAADPRPTPPTSPAAAPTAPWWTDEVTRASLQLIAEGLVELADFGVAAIAVADDIGLLHTISVAGSEDARRQLAGTATAVAELDAFEDIAQHWGMFWFVPAESRDTDRIAPPRWVPDVPASDDPERWQPLDALLAPLRDDAGVLRGTLAVDLPTDGRRPGPQQRTELNRYAEMARRTIVAALDRQHLADQVRLAASARAAVRQSAGALDVEELLERSGTALLDAFGATWLWLRVLRTDGGPPALLHVGADDALAMEPTTRPYTLGRARELWEERRADAFYLDVPWDPEPPGGETLRRTGRDLGLAGWLLAPVGVGSQFLGALTIARAAGGPHWSQAELETAYDLGSDLGRSVLNARALRQEQQVVRELSALDDYKNRLIRAVSDELSEPLTRISEGATALAQRRLPRDAAPLVASVERSGDRLQHLVGDLQLLARVRDPSHPVQRRTVRLDEVVRSVVGLIAPVARQRQVRLITRLPGTAVRTRGDAAELDRALLNLVGNAVKYSDPGGRVTVTLQVHRGEVEVTIADEGIGIAEDDRGQLFVEFFRSADPAAMERPGTGLGLAIVGHIVKRHRGRVEVCSTHGVGSTFRVILPAEGT